MSINIGKTINIILLIFIFFNIISLTKEKYLTIPFKVVYSYEPDSFTTLDDYFNYWSYISLYGEISVGTPPHKIITKLTFDDYGISVLNKGCDYNISSNDINTTLNLQNSSSSFNQTYDFFYGYETFYYKSFHDAFYAKDIFYFDSLSHDGKVNDNIKIENLSFIYSPNDNKQICTYFNIGLKAYCRNLRETSLNIIKQLKQFDIINSYDWSIIYDNNMKYPDKGVFLVGGKPHEYNPELFNENDIFGSGSISDETMPYFNFILNEIYFNSSLNTVEKISITDLYTVQLIPTYRLIKGSQDYERKIEIYFFSNFISENKCFKEYKDKENKNSFRTFVCYNKPDIKEELKTKFPILKLKQKNFLYTFELNYDDLFQEKGDKIYFLVWFSSNVQTSWELGHPFTKKYLFNYNSDNKLVSFYNKIKNEEDGNNESSKNSYLLKIIIVIILIIVATVLGFIIGMFFKKKKKPIAQELESESTSALFGENENHTE